MTDADSRIEPSQEGDDPDENSDGHLDDLPDGCGCAEVWEHLSERREE